MLRVLPVLIAIVLAVYCLVDVVMRSGDDVRYLPRWAWGAIIVIAPIVGPVGYLIVGREQRQTPAGPARSTSTPSPRRTIAPDDDPEFLNQVRRKRQQEQEEKLRRWQEELEERERGLQEQRDDDEGNGKGPTAGAS